MVVIWLNDTAKVFEEVNRKCAARNTTIKLSTLQPPTQNDPERYKAERYRQTDDSIVPTADHAACSSVREYVFYVFSDFKKT